MLKITMEFRRGILFVRMKGKYLNKNSALFHKRVIRKIEKNKILKVCLNLLELKEIEKKGIYDLFYLYEIVSNMGGKVYLCSDTLFNKLRKNQLFHYFIPIDNEIELLKEESWITVK